jgi:hypothetical protein
VLLLLLIALGGLLGLPRQQLLQGALCLVMTRHVVEAWFKLLFESGLKGV